MDSTRPIPFQAAQAYGMKPQRTAPRNTPSSDGVIRPAVNRPSDAVSLVSGRVVSPLSTGQGFDSPRSGGVPNPTGSLQMYGRAADRVEVATAARLGRLIDARA
jgi:hypothetical protein